MNRKIFFSGFRFYKTWIVFNIYFFSVFFILGSCSLKYDEEVSAEEKNPEFVFSETKLTRYEDNKKTVDLKAETIERYKNSNTNYAKKVAFTTFDKDFQVDTEGSCGYLYTDLNKELYELYDDIKLFSKKNDTHFSADVLRWNAKTEQLTSGRTNEVRLEKDGTVIKGTGFSASGVSGRFVFTGSVNGKISADSKKDTKNDGEE